MNDETNRLGTKMAVDCVFSIIDGYENSFVDGRARRAADAGRKYINGEISRDEAIKLSTKEWVEVRDDIGAYNVLAAAVKSVEDPDKAIFHAQMSASFRRLKLGDRLKEYLDNQKDE